MRTNKTALANLLRPPKKGIPTTYELSGKYELCLADTLMTNVPTWTGLIHTIQATQALAQAIQALVQAILLGGQSANPHINGKK